MKVHYITFISKGEPIDKGIPLGHLKEKLEKKHQDHFDRVTVYTSEDVPYEHRREYDPEIFETRFNHRYHNVGYGAFKPYLILKTLQETDCDLVFYRDGNLDKGDVIIDGVEDFKKLGIAILDTLKTDIFVPIENPYWAIGNTTPSIIFEKILGSVEEKYVSYPQMNASLIICKKTDYVKNFLVEWSEWMKHEEFFYREQHIKHANCNMNCGDQGVLNVMILKEIRNGKLPEGFPWYGYVDRHFKTDKMYKIVNTKKL